MSTAYDMASGGGGAFVENEDVYGTDIIQFKDAEDEAKFVSCNTLEPDSIKIDLESDPPTLEFSGNYYVGKVIPELFGKECPPRHRCSFQSSVLYEQTENAGPFRLVGIQRNTYEFVQARR